MEIEHIILIVLGVLAICWLILLACFVIACVCFFKTFYSPKSRKKMKNKVVDKASDIFIKNIDKLHAWKDEVASYPYEDVYITSFDGLKLHGKYYKVHENAPFEIFFHGYRGSADRDMNGGVLRALTHGRNALAVDQRGGGASEGTLGICHCNSACGEDGNCHQITSAQSGGKNRNQSGNIAERHCRDHGEY